MLAFLHQWCLSSWSKFKLKFEFFLRGRNLCVFEQAANLLEDKMKEKDNIRLNDIRYENVAILSFFVQVCCWLQLIYDNVSVWRFDRILQEDHQAEIELLHQMYKKLMADEKTRTDAAYGEFYINKCYCCLLWIKKLFPKACWINRWLRLLCSLA